MWKKIYKAIKNITKQTIKNIKEIKKRIKKMQTLNLKRMLDVRGKDMGKQCRKIKLNRIRKRRIK